MSVFATYFGGVGAHGAVISGGVGAHGTVISAGSGFVVPPKDPQTGTKRHQQRYREREGENDEVRTESRWKNPADRKAPIAFLLVIYEVLRSFREKRGCGQSSRIDLKIVVPKSEMEPRFGLETQVGMTTAA